MLTNHFPSPFPFTLCGTSEELEGFEFQTWVCGSYLQCPNVYHPDFKIDILSFPFAEPEVWLIPFFAAMPEVRLWCKVIGGRPLEVCTPHAWLSACQGE